VSQQRVGRRALKSRPTRVLLQLNEHGPALNVFWTPGTRGWAQRWSDLTVESGGYKEKCPKKTEPEGTGRVACSFRFEKWEDVTARRISARTRWVTERIASHEAGPKSGDEITGSSQFLRSRCSTRSADPQKKNGNGHLFAVD